MFGNDMNDGKIKAVVIMQYTTTDLPSDIACNPRTTIKINNGIAYNARRPEKGYFPAIEHPIAKKKHIALISIGADLLRIPDAKATAASTSTSTTP